MNDETTGLPEADEGDTTEEATGQRRKRRRLPLLLGVAGAVVVAAVGLTVALTLAAPGTRDAADGDVPLAGGGGEATTPRAGETVTLADGTTATLNADGTASTADGTVLAVAQVQAALPGGGSSANGNGGGGSSSGGGSGAVWHDGWDEWVVDAAGHYETVYHDATWGNVPVPIYGYVATDGTPLPPEFGSWTGYEQGQWMDMHGGGYHTGLVGYQDNYQIIAPPWNEQVWIPEQGHWQHREGHWG